MGPGTRQWSDEGRWEVLNRYRGNGVREAGAEPGPLQHWGFDRRSGLGLALMGDSPNLNGVDA
jgi:hypothetical protein